MQELYLKNNKLIHKSEWGKLISALKPKELTTNKEQAKQLLREKLISAVKKRIPNKKFGIFFSGGVDSSLIAAICKLLNANFVCYAVGFQEDTKEPEDITEAKRVAEKLGFKLQYKIYNLNEAENIIKKTVKILKPFNKTDVVNIGVGSVVVAAAELGHYSGIKYFLGGLGSEEIFAGYERHDKAKKIANKVLDNVNEECWQGLKQMWERDLVRDFNLAKTLQITIKTPFLDEELIKVAMQLPGKWKIIEEKKKVILREVAEEFLGEFAWRKKKAAQYGSCFDKAISKLAKKNGFKLKKEWLESL